VKRGEKQECSSYALMCLLLLLFVVVVVVVVVSAVVEKLTKIVEIIFLGHSSQE